MNDQDTKFLDELQDLSNAIQPDSAFLSRLETRLLAESKPHATRRRRPAPGARAMVTLAAAFGLISLLFLASPALRSIAQDILEYFERDDDDTFPVAPVPLDIAEAPFDRSAYEADLRASAIPVEKAEARLGFDILVPSEIPAGYEFLGAQPTPEIPFVTLLFWSPEGRELRINQWPTHSAANDDTSTWSQIARSANVQSVSVNGAHGEYVEGGWAVFPGQDEAQWMPEMSQRRLRWQQGDMVFEIIAMGGSPADAGAANYSYLGQQEMIALAKSMS